MTEGCGADAVFRCSLLALVLAGATNTVVAVVDAAAWAWWVATACLLAALVLGTAWSGPGGQRAPRRSRTQQARLIVGEVELAALVHRDP